MDTFFYFLAVEVLLSIFFFGTFMTEKLTAMLNKITAKDDFIKIFGISCSGQNVIGKKQLFFVEQIKPKKSYKC